MNISDAGAFTIRTVAIDHNGIAFRQDTTIATADQVDDKARAMRDAFKSYFTKSFSGNTRTYQTIYSPTGFLAGQYGAPPRAWRA